MPDQIDTINVTDRVGEFARLTFLPSYAEPDFTGCVTLDDVTNRLLEAGATTGDASAHEGYGVAFFKERGKGFAVVTSPPLA